MNLFSSFLLAVVILAYCLINSLSLLSVWLQFSFYERYSWVILLIWCLPILFYWIGFFSYASKEHSFNPLLLGAALFFSLFGNLGALNTLNYIGLALVLSSFVPWSWVTFIWLLSSFTWMPATSWFGSHMGLPYLFLIRFVIAFTIALWFIINLRKQLSLEGK